MVTAHNLMKSKKEGKLKFKISGLLWLTAIGTQDSYHEAAGPSLHYATLTSVSWCETTKRNTTGAMPFNLLMCGGGQHQRD